MDHFDKVNCDSVSVPIQRALQTITAVLLPRFPEPWSEKWGEISVKYTTPTTEQVLTASPEMSCLFGLLFTDLKSKQGSEINRYLSSNYPA